MESSRNSRRKTPLPFDTLELGDCLDVVGQWPHSFADLVYVDPPFYTQKRHSLATRDRSRVYSFSDLWQDSTDYGEFLLQRMRVCWDALKETGSIFFHCDRSGVHIARTVLDAVFGVNNFRSEIIWSYKRWSNSRRGLLPSHQNILYYTKSDTYKFNPHLTAYSPSTNVDQILQQRRRDTNGKSTYQLDSNGEPVSNGSKKGVPLGDVWDIPYLNPKAKERVGYPTQKPILLLERIIEIASNPGDCVLDPFCGSGTTLVAAHLNDRKYVGIDISEDAIALASSRLSNPIRSSSALLTNGRESYRNCNESVLKYLRGVAHTPVQRNRGIDAILHAEVKGKPVLLRVQRANETIEECTSMLLKATRRKNAGMRVVLKTCDVPTLDFAYDDLSDDVVVINSVEHALATALEKANGQI